jgi:hypothetical protein
VHIRSHVGKHLSDEECSRKRRLHIAIIFNVALEVSLEESLKIGRDFKLGKIRQLLVRGGDLLAKIANIINTPY